MAEISIIMPSLNVRKYIMECIESILGQSFKNIEILCIDAGSTDGTLEILREYETRDSRVKVVLSSKRSYGYQVNLGIWMASGSYIGIVDTDDIVEQDMYQHLYNAIIRENADYAKGTFQLFADVGDGRIIQYAPIWDWEDGEASRIISPKEIPEVILWDGYLWNGLYKTSFVRKLKLNESDGAAYQDLGFIYQVYTKANKAVYINEVVYDYRQDNSNNSCASTKAFQYIVQELEYVSKLPGGVPDRYKPVLYAKIFGMTNVFMKRMGITKRYWEEAEEYIKDLQMVMDRACEEKTVMEYCQKSQGNILEIFLESPYKLFEFYKTSYSEKEEVFKKILALPEPYVIFGSGNFGRFVHITLMGLGKQIVAFCDNDRELWGGINIQGTPIMSIHDAVQKYPKATYIAASKKYVDEMEEQLIHAGIMKKQIIKYTQGCEGKMFFLYLR